MWKVYVGFAATTTRVYAHGNGWFNFEYKFLLAVGIKNLNEFGNNLLD